MISCRELRERCTCAHGKVKRRWRGKQNAIAQQFANCEFPRCCVALRHPAPFYWGLARKPLHCMALARFPELPRSVRCVEKKK